VEFRKFDGSPHWAFDCLHLGQDSHGEWFGAPPGTIAHRPGGREKSARTVEWDRPVLFLAPPEAWWTLTFNLDSSPPLLSSVPRLGELYGDVGTPIELSRQHADGESGGRLLVRLIDLDLDIRRKPGEEPYVDDEDEFAARQESMRYPEHIVRGARAGAHELFAIVAANDEPIRSRYLRWAKLLISSSRPRRPRTAPR
jgi:hypothetical protein